MKIQTAEKAGTIINNKACILIVDDEYRLLKSLENMLLNQGYNVHCAQGGLHACEQLSEQTYDLVLLDLNMPDMNGHQVMDFMVQKDIDTATIVVSGESSFSAVSKALRRGAYDYIKKPYDPVEMLSTIDNALQKVILEKAHSVMQSRLKKSEELHRYIVNSSPDIVFMLDPKGCFTFLNSKIESILGYKKAELIGKPYQSIVDPMDIQRAIYIFDEQSIKKPGAWSSEIRLKAKKSDHTSRHFEITFFPIENKAKNNKKTSTTHLEQGKTRVIGTYGTARDITDRKEAEEFINFQAYHDLLTRLPNRALFKDRLNISLAQAKRNKNGVAVMFLDLDRFKIVNDTLGHAMGDRLLQSVALRLENCVRKCDTLSRFGGDEFTLLLPSISSAEDARTIAKKVIATLKEPFMLGEHEVFVGVSIGISIYPDAGLTVDGLIQNADVAMYHVKNRGKDGYQFFSDTMAVNTSNRLSLERDLRNALDKNEFRVFYQPQINAISGKVIGVEALVRWQHPERGLIYPGEFIPLAEETRLMSDINDWVLMSACTEIKGWIDAGHKDIRLSVNFSPLQVEHPKFVHRLLARLRQANFPPQNLEIELTENVIMNDLEHMVQKLNLLTEHGLKIAIDDFGTGYSSLNYLRKLPIHTLKVDQSFIHDIKDSKNEACIVNAIVSMAHGLKLNIIAEGVETKAQLDYLKVLGCQEIQGFYFGKAEPGYKALELINQGTSQSLAC
ncbi:MAG: diguanylate cyclase (GGDEF)-like protein/PAS domain S-box-containing protein [Pseudohongiellaceae bacterium]|jgi:diguanylate cyclase (GGDEF)-like protein/PAS domain S-box-containing protein